MSVSWHQFKKNQDRIYEVIRSKRTILEQSGTVTDPGLMNHRGAFTIALLHSHTASSVFSRQSRQISRLTDAIVYEPQHTHTTLIGLPFEHGFAYQKSSREQVRILSSLVRAAQRALRTYKRSTCTVRYNEYLSSPESTIARGIPSQGFVELVSVLLEEGKKEGLPVVPTWGAHVTVSRFTHAHPARDIQPLLTFLSNMEAPGLSVAREIAVGYSLWEHPTGSPKDGVIYNGSFSVHRRLPLRTR